MGMMRLGLMMLVMVLRMRMRMVVVVVVLRLIKIVARGGVHHVTSRSRSAPHSVTIVVADTRFTAHH